MMARVPVATELVQLDPVSHVYWPIVRVGSAAEVYGMTMYVVELPDDCPYASAGVSAFLGDAWQVTVLGKTPMLKPRVKPLGTVARWMLRHELSNAPIQLSATAANLLGVWCAAMTYFGTPHTMRLMLWVCVLVFLLGPRKGQ